MPCVAADTSREPTARAAGAATPRLAFPKRRVRVSPTVPSMEDETDAAPIPEAEIDAALEVGGDETPNLFAEMDAKAAAAAPPSSEPSVLPNAAERVSALLANFEKKRQTYLRLEHMQLGDEGVEVLAEAIRKGTGAQQLKSLYLSSNGITDVGAHALVEALRTCPPCRLRFLYMDHNPKIGRNVAVTLQRMCDRRVITLVGLGTIAAPPTYLPPSPAEPGRTRLVSYAPATALPPAADAPLVELMPCNRAGLRPRQLSKSASAISMAPSASSPLGSGPPSRLSLLRSGSPSRSSLGSAASFFPIARLHGSAGERRRPASATLSRTSSSSPKAMRIPRVDYPSSEPRYRASSSPKAMRIPRVDYPSSEPRYRATKPCGPEVTRFDMMPCARTNDARTRRGAHAYGDSVTRWNASLRQGLHVPPHIRQKQQEADLAAFAELREQVARKKLEQAVETKKLLDYTRQREFQLRERAFAHRIPWWQRQPPEFDPTRPQSITRL